MKKILLSIVFVGVATFANAQKSEVAEAVKAWNVFQFTLTNDPDAGKPPVPVKDPKGPKKPTFIEKQIASLTAGLVHVDKALTNEKTKNLAQTWVHKALFTAAIAYVDTLNLQNSLAQQKIAEDALAKTKALDVKNEEKDNIKTVERYLNNTIRVRSVGYYKQKDFVKALAGFNELIALNPLDTPMYLNAGLTARLIENYPEAVKNFKKVISFNTPDTKDMYTELINITLDKLKDTVGGLAIIKEANAKFPDDANFIGAETDIYITRGDIKNSQEMLNKLIAKEPKKELYQYLMGETYYKQALGLQTQRNKIDQKKVKEFDAMTAKMTGLIDQSLVFYKKAIEFNPKYAPALETLKVIYGFKNDTVNYEIIKKQLEAIK